MNRAFFIILLILLIVVPTTISINDTSQVSPIQVLVEKTKNFLIKSLVDEPREIVISNEQKLLINQKLNSLQNGNELFFVKYEQANIQNQKKINTFLAFYNWEQFSRENSGVKGIYLNGYHFTNEEKMKKFDEILINTSVNTVVLDVKTDNGHLLYDSKIIEVDELKNERIKYDKNTLKEFKEKYNIYLIGRVVAFQDPIFSKNTLMLLL